MIFAERRERFLAAMGEGVAVFPAAPVLLRNNDVEYPYRQDSDFYYLTGFDEPEAYLLLTTSHPEHRAVLFVRRRDPDRERWDGAREGVEGVKARPGIDAAYPVDEFPERLASYLENAPQLHCRLGQRTDFDARVFDALDKARARARHGVRAPEALVDPARVLHELRLRKNESDLVAMRRAIAVTAEAHLATMRAAAPGRLEYELEAEFVHACRIRGSARQAYEPIVASGPNATVLHYRSNNRKLHDRDLLLVDAGCEFDYMASDITRTFPISGRFTPEQRAVYDIVLESQERAIEAVRPGATLDDVHSAAVRVLVRGLIDLEILRGSVDENIERGAYRAYYMHRTSHWLGMDVHDVGTYFIDGKARPLEAGFVLTVEPGLYFSEDCDADPKWRGIGIRIEDDVLVTDSGAENLSRAIPKRADELESIVGNGS